MYKELAEVSEGLYDAFAKDHKRKAECLKEWGITKSKVEHRYYEDQSVSRV